jgi:hypothetical protein
MALITLGSLVGQVSGRIGSVIFAHNRGGQYARNGSIPVKVVSDKALRYKAIFASASQAWRGSTDAVRKAWNVYASSQTVTNRLGRTITPTGQSLFIGLNSRLAAAGDAGITAPPTKAAPEPAIPTTFTVDAGAGDTEIAFADGPLAAGIRLWIRGAKVNSGAVTNIQNLLTEILITAKAAASPVDLEDELIAAFGPLQVGATYILEMRTLDSTTGLVSGAFYAKTVAVST